ncbi:hypothetical protein [Vibrio parahaemolyticus]|uniref:hypothetical protein n=1 Tax=Vibrio parahaemolyticus TaxID=670 RepID=UPI001595F16E|nr:hypothetical protein [Vibrio parahaemolyticus]
MPQTVVLYVVLSVYVNHYETKAKEKAKKSNSAKAANARAICEERFRPRTHKPFESDDRPRR